MRAQVSKPGEATGLFISTWSSTIYPMAIVIRLLLKFILWIPSIHKASILAMLTTNRRIPWSF